MTRAIIDEIDRTERRARFAAWKERDRVEAEKAVRLESPEVRARIATGLGILRRWLAIIPHTYRGPYASAWDVDCEENFQAFLARDDVQAAIEAARPVYRAPPTIWRAPAAEIPGADHSGDATDMVDALPCKESLHTADEPPVPVAPPDGPNFEGDIDYIPE